MLARHSQFRDRIVPLVTAWLLAMATSIPASPSAAGASTGSRQTGSRKTGTTPSAGVRESPPIQTVSVEDLLLAERLLHAAASVEDATLAAVLLLEAARLGNAVDAFEGARLARMVSGSMLTDLRLRGDRHEVLSAEFSPDGRHIVAAARDGTARVWNADGSGAPLELEGHANTLWSASFSPDGRRIATASEDGTVRVWSIDGSGEPLVLRGPERRDDFEGRMLRMVWDVAWSPDGRQIASAWEDGKVRIWNVASGEVGATLKGHRDKVRSVAYSPDGRLIVTASRDGTARIWNADAKGKCRILKGHGHAVTSAEFSPGGSRILTASSDRTARIWNADGEGEPLVVYDHEDSVSSAAWSPDGRYVVTASDDGKAQVWMADGATSHLVLKGHERWVRSAAWSPDGRRIVTASGDGTLRVWRFEDTGETILGGHRGAVTSAAWSPDGERIATGSVDGLVRVWSADGSGAPLTFGNRRIKKELEQKKAFLRSGDPVHSVAFGPGGARVAAGHRDGTIRIWSFEDPDNPVVLSGSRQTGSGRAVRGGRARAVEFLAFCPGGDLLASLAACRDAFLWKVDGSAEPRVVGVHQQAGDAPGRVAAFSPDCRKIVARGDDRIARVWQVDGEGDPRLLGEHHGGIHGAAFSPDGRQLVTAALGEIRLWRSDGTVLPMPIRQGRVQDLVYSSDGGRFAFISGDPRKQMQTQIWRSDGRGEPMILTGHQDAVLSLAFSPDGDHLVTASADGSARIWRASWPALIDFLASATRVCLTPEERSQYLAEPLVEARLASEACERSHGRGMR